MPAKIYAEQVAELIHRARLIGSITRTLSLACGGDEARRIQDTHNEEMAELRHLIATLGFDPDEVIQIARELDAAAKVRHG